MNHDTWILGVDAGGTKTVAKLGRLVSTEAPFDTAIERVAEGLAGPGNPMATGFDSATNNLLEAVRNACSSANLSPGDLAAACLGVAGAGRREVQHSLTAWMKTQMPTGRVQVSTDATIVLAALQGGLAAHQLAQMHGIALISGTGSMAWGRKADGTHLRCGGWGYVLGDEASGYWIARRALQAACRAVDGRGAATQLVEAFSQHWQLGDWSEVVPKVYSPDFQRSDLAALSPIVTRLADSDPVAAAILDEAAEELAAMIHASSQRLGLQGTLYPIGLAGGTLTESPDLVERLKTKLAVLHTPMPALRLVREPVVGALVLAAHLAIHGTPLS